MKRPTKKAPARRKAARPKLSTSTALARRQTLAIEVIDPRQRLPEAPGVIEGIIADQVTVGDLGLSEVTLTEKEEMILNQPVDPDRILIKPTGQPYLSHPEYTRWFNQAFGRLGWSLVQKGKAVKQQDGKRIQVVCPYVLYIHRQAAAFAWGEQEYWEDNKEQTYGDALEATVASALRRCAKRLGVGLEMWDKHFLRTWIEQRAIKVKLEPGRNADANAKAKYAWRLKTDPPFWNEVKPGTRQREAGEERPPKREAPKAGTNTEANEPITEAQADRLWKLAVRAGRGKQALRSWLAVAYDVGSLKEIKRRDYDAICAAVEAPGGLPDPREPGQEG